MEHVFFYGKPILKYNKSNKKHYLKEESGGFQ